MKFLIDFVRLIGFVTLNKKFGLFKAKFNKINLSFLSVIHYVGSFELV